MDLLALLGKLAEYPAKMVRVSIMNTNLKVLIKACQRMGVDYKIYHKDRNMVEVLGKNNSYLFINFTTPLHSHGVARLCEDKDYFYSFFKDVINMPRGRAFVNPHADPKYFQGQKEKTIAEILTSISKEFQYPLIVKRNSGTTGNNVFKVNSKSELKEAIEAIFNINSKDFDRIAIAQEYLRIRTEYRAVYVNGELSFAYEKSIRGAKFQGNLSPLHWEGAKALLIEDGRLLAQIKQFCAPIFVKKMIPFCGLDIAIDKNSQWWLIEANSSPAFAHIVADGGEDKVIEMYEGILTLLS
ncbi:MAG: alpha-L-glutamate ligase [Hormoscilla sp. GM7CHS1pb]|nr:alpha-L-glutamate ligase [Hormoscilla sp. GM7CHS1pb]